MHIPVLLHEVIAGLSPKAGEVFVDATVGSGGHSVAAYAAAAGIKVVGIDADRDAIERSNAALTKRGARFTLVRENFRNLDRALSSVGEERADKILFDLGVSSEELTESGRGFSFQKDEPLQMTFANPQEKGALTAEDIVNSWDEKNIATIIRSYGEERQARRIAKAIVAAREKKRIGTSGALVAVVERAVGRRGRLHPATKTFRALRMAVNDEVESLKVALRKGFSLLSRGGGMAVISFHRTEDRIVKQFFAKCAKEGSALLIAKKPIVPSREECVRNPRARSAKLRIIEKV